MSRGKKLSSFISRVKKYQLLKRKAVKTASRSPQRVTTPKFEVQNANGNEMYKIFLVSCIKSIKL